MISRIESIQNENTQAYWSAIQSFEESLKTLETSIRGRVNNTVISDRKNRISPLPAEETITTIKPNEKTKPLSQSRLMPGIEKGEFRINNTAIFVDPSVDTFNDIVDRISSSTENVTASFDPSTQRLNIVSRNGAKTISITNDTSNFIREANLNPGSYTVTTDGPMYQLNQDERKVSDIQANIETFKTEINALLGDQSIPETVRIKITDDLIETISKNKTVNPDGEQFFLDWGLNVDLNKGNPDSVVTTNRDLSRSNLQKDSRDIVKFFSGDSKDEGYISRAYQSIAEINKQAIDATA